MPSENPPTNGVPTFKSRSEIDYRHAKDQETGLDYAWRYQFQAGPLSARGKKPYWYPLRSHGLELFVCDTRSERVEPRTIDRSSAKIMSNVQMTALCDWLLELQNKKYAGPKFIVSPVPMFPVRSMNHTLAVASDGWERYPESMATLLHHIVIHELDNVVILSGDAHCFHDVTTEVKHEKNTIQIRSVTTPGLYSPYPFANRQPNEVLSAASGSLEAMGVQWTYGETRACASLAGWVELRARVSCGQIEVNLHDVGTA